MKFINTTFAHGNGPYSRCIDLGLAINREMQSRRQEKMPIIVPLVYKEKDRQKIIMQEQFGEVIEQDPDMILLDSFHGDILKQLLFQTGDYAQNLELLVEKQPELEAQLRDRMSTPFTVERFDGTEVQVNPSDIVCEVTHNPRVTTGVDPSFYTTIAFFSEIMYRTMLEDGLDLDANLLNDVRKLADKIEDAADIHFMPEPFTFSYVPGRERWKGEIFTPPFIPMPAEHTEDVPEGMYVMVTGIDGLMGLFDAVGDFGMKLYCPPFVKLEDADNRFTPDFVSNRNITRQFGRTGWSTVWWSHMTGTPLITPAYVHGDDPEIYFNEKTVKSLGLAVVFDETKDPKKVLEAADRLRPNLIDINTKLERDYGTLDGVAYTAKVIADHLSGNDIEEYRKIQPILQG